MKKIKIDQLHVSMLFSAIILFLVVFIASLAIVFKVQTVNAVSSGKQKEKILVKSYEFADNKGYPVSGSKPISKFCYGRTSIGSMFLEASTIIKLSENNFAVSPDVNIYYDLSGIPLDNLGNGWRLSSDTANSIDGYKFNTKLQKGGLIYRYNYDGSYLIFKSHRNVLADFDNKKNSILPKSSEQEYINGIIQANFGGIITPSMIQDSGIDSMLGEMYLNWREYHQIEHKLNFRLGYEIMTFNQKDYRNLVEDYEFSITISDNLSVNENSAVENTEYNSTKIIKSQSYNFPDKQKYSRKNNADSLTQTLPFGLQTAGRLKLNTMARESVMPNGIPVYFVKNAVTLTYEDVCIKNNRFNNTAWELSSDGDKGFDNIDNSIGTGAINVQKKYLEGFSPSGGLLNISNIFNVSLNGKILNYTPIIDDLRRGIELTIRIAYEIRNTQTGEYRNILEYYHFVLISDDHVTFHNLSLNDAIYGELADDVNFDTYKIAETLVDGSVTRTGFRVDFNQNSPTIMVMYSYNNGDFSVLKNGTKFTSQGKYRFFIITIDGKIVRDITIYIDRENISDIQRRYISDNPFDEFLNGQRLFDANYAIPVYSTLSPMLIEHAQVNSIFPSFYYAITEDGEAPTSFSKFDKDISFEMQQEVVYTLYLRNMQSDTTPGDHVVFTLQWTALEREAVPTLNYNNYSILLNNATSRQNLKDRFYQVKTRPYNSTGTYYFVFDLSSYDVALDFAIELEKHLVKENQGGYLYRGVRYDAQDLAMLKMQMMTNASQNVEEAYFQDSITLSDKKIDDVLTITTDKDLYVFPNEAEKSKMLTTKEYPYGNNFEFVSAGKFESCSVIAELVFTDDENATIGSKFVVPYNTRLEEVLPFNGLYTITEKNKYDKERTFSMYIVHNNTVAFSLYDGEQFTSLAEFGGKNVGGVMNIETESDYVLLDGGSSLDPYFKTYLNGKLYSAEELRAANIKLYPDITYNIRCEDRFGHSVSNIVKINKKAYTEQPQKPNVSGVEAGTTNTTDGVVNGNNQNPTLGGEVQSGNGNLNNQGNGNLSSDATSEVFIDVPHVLTETQVHYIRLVILIAIGAVALIALIIIACLIWANCKGRGVK